MINIPPFVRHFIVCEDVQVDSREPLQVSPIHLLGTINARSIPAFPHCHPEFSIYVELSACRGGELFVRVVHSNTNIVIFRTMTYGLPINLNPRDVVPLALRLRNCTFPSAGVYWVELWYNGFIYISQSMQVEE